MFFLLHGSYPGKNVLKDQILVDRDIGMGFNSSGIEVRTIMDSPAPVVIEDDIEVEVKDEEIRGVGMPFFQLDGADEVELCTIPGKFFSAVIFSHEYLSDKNRNNIKNLTLIEQIEGVISSQETTAAYTSLAIDKLKVLETEKTELCGGTLVLGSEKVDLTSRLKAEKSKWSSRIRKLTKYKNYGKKRVMSLKGERSL